MNTDSLQKALGRFKNPTTQLVTVIVLGLLLIVFLFTKLILPSIEEKNLLNQNINNLELQRNLINRSALPDKIAMNDVELLLAQVPTQLDLSRLLLDFGSVERDSGAIITDLSIGNQETEVKDELSDYIENALKKAPVAAATTTTVPTTQLNAANSTNVSTPVPVPKPNEPKLTTPIKPEILSLKATGTYLQVIDFMEGLYKINRIVNIRDWSLAPKDANQYVIEFGLTVYTAPKYAKIFHDLQTNNTAKP